MSADSTPTIITPELLPPALWREARPNAESRSSIAVLIWAIVSEFIHSTDQLTAEPGEPFWRAAEEFIRDHADEAERDAIAWGRRAHHAVGAVIMEVLAELDLADDYMRIKRNQQHKAFEGEEARA